MRSGSVRGGHRGPVIDTGIKPNRSYGPGRLYGRTKEDHAERPHRNAPNERPELSQTSLLSISLGFGETGGTFPPGGPYRVAQSLGWAGRKAEKVHLYV